MLSCTILSISFSSFVLPAGEGTKSWDGLARLTSNPARLLRPLRHVSNRFGGSHAQRDIIDWTLTESALRAGQTGMAEALAHERLALRPHSPVNRGFLRRAQATKATSRANRRVAEAQ